MASPKLLYQESFTYLGGKVLTYHFTDGSIVFTIDLKIFYLMEEVKKYIEERDAMDYND